MKAIVIDEWPAMERGAQAASASAAYDVLLREVVDPKIASETGVAVHTALLNATVRVGTARSDRLALASDRTNDLKWVVVLTLGVMTQVSIGLLHLQKRNAHVAALATFTRGGDRARADRLAGAPIRWRSARRAGTFAGSIEFADGRLITHSRRCA